MTTLDIESIAKWAAHTMRSLETQTAKVAARAAGSVQVGGMTVVVDAEDSPLMMCGEDTRQALKDMS